MCALISVFSPPINVFLIYKKTDMMTLLGAKERSRAEYAALFRSSGLELTQVTGVEGEVNVIEAHPLL